MGFDTDTVMDIGTLATGRVHEEHFDDMAPHAPIPAHQHAHGHANGNTYLIGGTDANSTPDFQIEFAGIKVLTADNFIGLDHVALTGTGDS